MRYRLSAFGEAAARQHAVCGTPREDWLLQQASLLESVVGSTSGATIICDETTRLRSANAAASALLMRADGISLKSGCLSIADCGARQRLRAIVERPARDPSAIAALLVPRPSGLPSYQAVIKSLVPNEPDDHAVALWTVFISDPGFVGPEQLRAIAWLYDLTPAETRLAEQLMLGATVDEAAASMRLSVCTIRSQLSSILRKAGARRQAELVRLFSAVPA